MTQWIEARWGVPRVAVSRVRDGQRILGKSFWAPRWLARWVRDRFRWIYGYNAETEGTW